MKRITRRALVSGGLAVAGAAALEALSLRGWFDWRRPLAATALDRFRASRARILREPKLAQASLVHVGHSTHLLAIGGRAILTDPWFGDPAFGRMSHAQGPAAAAAEVGPIDAVLISHDHPDHADRRALAKLDKRALAIVATPGLADEAKRMGFQQVEVMAPWASILLGRHCVVTAVPALHDVPEIGFVVQGGGASVYFAGDTRLHDDLPKIAERFHPTLAILPVDGTRMRGGEQQSMSPDDALQAARTLGAQQVMPSHDEASFARDPLARLLVASTFADGGQRFAELVRDRLPGVTCHLPAPGELIAL